MAKSKDKKFSFNFFNHFPVPQMLAMPAVGVDINEDAVRFVQYEKKSDYKIIKNFGEYKLPKGVIKNGEVVDAKTLGGMLQKLKSDLKIDFANFSIPEDRSYLFKTEVPKEGYGNVREYIELRLEENVPLKPSEVVFDYSVIRNVKTKDSHHLDVVVSVMPLKIIMSFVEVFQSAGLDPLIVQSEGSAIVSSVIGKNNQDTNLIVNFAESKTGLTLVSKGVIRYSSTLNIGGNIITDAIAKQFKVTASEAELIKKEKGYIRNKDNVELFFSLMNALSAFRDDVRKLIQYWGSREELSEEEKKIDRIILCGKNSALVGFDEYLAISLGINSELANVWSNAFTFEDFVPQIHILDSLDYAAPSGLALTNLV